MSKERDFTTELEKFTLDVLKIKFPNSDLIREPYLVESCQGMSLPDFEFRLNGHGYPVLVEVTKSLISNGRDPKRRQRKVLYWHELGVNNHVRSLVLYGQHYHSLGVIHAWMGLLEGLAEGRIETTEARSKAKDLTYIYRVPDGFQPDENHIKILREELVNLDKRLVS